MAGRLLPIALSAVAGISIGVATFDGEFKKQRAKRLQEEYEQEVAAMSASNRFPAATMPSKSPTPPAEPLSAEKRGFKASEATTSSWTSIFGLWAWSGSGNKLETTTPQAPAKVNVEQVKGKP